MTDLATEISSNGFLAIVPILAWNIAMSSRLPPAYQPGTFDREVPTVVAIGENFFRYVVFLAPLFFRLDASSPAGRTGLMLYSLGVAMYLASWLTLIRAPDSGWSRSILGFTAPAFTPIVWLVGLSLLVDSCYFGLPYSRWHYILPSMAFSIFHLSHAVSVYGRTYR